MFVHNLDPVLVSLGPLEIRYYGLFYVLGFVIAYFMLNALAKRKHLPLTKDDVADYILYIIIGTIVGARLFYVVIYNFDVYVASPLDAFKIWQGGLSFHGGFTGALLGAYLFCRKKKVHLYDMLDLSVLPLALGLALGRIGNFINGELFGRVTDVSWAVKFPGSEEFRHPSQLYASFKNLAIFAILWFLKDKKLPRGVLFWSFGLLYSVFRFIVEFFREPDPQLGFVLGILSMGQVLSLILFVVSAFFMWYLLKK